MKKTSVIIVMGAAGLLCLVSPVPAQLDNFFSSTTIQPGFWIDHAVFKSPVAGKTRLEIYYKVYNFMLTFHPRGSILESRYDVNVTIEDDDGLPVDVYSAEKKIVAVDEATARSRADYRTSQVNFDLDHGEYKVRFTLQDVNTEETLLHEFDVELRDFNVKYPAFSEVTFVGHVQPPREETGVFRKGNLMVVPSVSRDFQGEDDSRLLYYLEIYPGRDQTQSITVETIIRSLTRGMVYRDTMGIALDQPVVRQLREISSAEFPAGQYELEVYLRGRRNKKLDSQRRGFTILWSQRALLKHDFGTAMAQLALIAPSSEIKTMKNLKTLDERLRAFDDFWLARDPTVGTPENEVKREFYRRINYANLRFRDLRRAGWRTDRGIIYVKHGEPDQIDDYPMSPESMPYQTWHYYRRGRYLRFLFVDENLDGDYRLQFPYDGLDQTPDF
jgi:GWxTD domain-containing protein